MPQLKLHHDEHKTTTICPQPYKQADCNYYEMKASKHGVALIISNPDFMWYSSSMQTERDEYNLIQTFYFLGYRPIVCNDLTSDEIRNIIGNLDAFLTNSNDIATANVENDSFVCCVMSHSHRDMLHDIVRLTGESQILRGKPKIFFAYHVVISKPHLIGSRLRIPHVVDSYVCSAVVSMDTALRDVYSSQWFITQLCKTLCQYGTCDTLSNLCGRHHLYVREHTMSHRKQPSMDSTLKSEVHFFFE